MCLAMAGHRKIVSLLIDHKANVDCVNLFGETPQKLAKLERHFSLKFLPSSLLEKENGSESSGSANKRTEHFLSSFELPSLTVVSLTMFCFCWSIQRTQRKFPIY